MRRLWLLAAVFGLCAHSFSQNDFALDRVVLTKEGARYVTPPQVLVDRTVESFWLSPSGNAIISKRIVFPRVVPSWLELDPEVINARLAEPRVEIL